MSKRRTNLDRSQKLSKNFYLYEFDCRDGTPIPDMFVPDLKERFVVPTLQLLRDFFDARITVTSGYRTHEYNERIGGSKNSYHVYDKRPGFYAADIVVHGVAPNLVYTVLEGLDRTGIIQIGGLHAYDKFVHVDNGIRDRRW